MTPLTHAAVGMVVCRSVRSAGLGRFGWPLALVLAFASHFLLDSIPHLDAQGPLRDLRSSSLLFPAFGVAAAALTWLVYRRNPGAAWIWIFLSVWLVISGFSGALVRGLAALVLVGLLFYRTRQADSPGYLLAGILAISADFVPKTFGTLVNFHDGLHYNVGWGTSLFLQFQDPPLLSGLARLQNPYYLMGYGLEFLVETALFVLAFVSLSRLALDPKPAAEEAVPSSQPEETHVPA